ncbi:MAG TPA: CGNR zinc finger domain-containing protein [Jatrophihabitans sp.]|nr:CGNR zinc finger domain-containing protein [Jatrophihabitans sp.]
MPQHYEVVDGEPLPVQLGGHPALDFCNTWAGWDGHDAGDYLVSYRSLAVWSAWVGLLSETQARAAERDAAHSAGRAATVLERARRFRAGLYEVLTTRAALLPWPQPLVDELRGAVGACSWSDDPPGPRWAVDPDAGVAAPLAAVAWSALGLLTSSELARIRICPGPGCGWLFVDPSGRRKWCSMATCGNRAKARRFADRARAARG